MPKFTLRNNGEEMTTFICAIRYDLTREELADADAKAKICGYKNFRDYCRKAAPDVMTRLYDDADMMGDSKQA